MDYSIQRTTTSLWNGRGGRLGEAVAELSVLLLSSGGSCVRLPEPFRTLEGCIIAYVASCARATSD